MLIRERRQVAQGLGGTHWQERVTTHDGRQALPEGAEKAGDDAAEYDWRPMVPQPDDAGNPVEPTPAPVARIPLSDSVVSEPDLVH